MSKPNAKHKPAKKNAKPNFKAKKAKKPVKSVKFSKKPVKKAATNKKIKLKVKPKPKLAKKAKIFKKIVKVAKKPFKKPGKKPHLALKTKKMAKKPNFKARPIASKGKIKPKILKPVKKAKAIKAPKPKKLTKKEIKEQELKQKQLMMKALQQAMAVSLEALLKESGVRNLLIETAGENTIAVLKELTSLGEDEKIAQKLGVKVSQVRSVLNKLHMENIVSYERTKDDQTGWYYYNWLLNMDKLLEWVKNKNEMNAKMIEESAKIEQYFCVKCGTVHMFEQAMECSFKCITCNSSLDLVESKPKKPSNLF